MESTNKEGEKCVGEGIAVVGRRDSHGGGKGEE